MQCDKSHIVFIKLVCDFTKWCNAVAIAVIFATHDMNFFFRQVNFSAKWVKFAVNITLVYLNIMKPFCCSATVAIFVYHGEFYRIFHVIHLIKVYAIFVQNFDEI